MTDTVRNSAGVNIEKVLAGLKDFQRRTVDYVFERMYGSKGVDRFLVADEVGLGKTMVARGIVAKAVEYLSKDSGKRIDVVYLCANRDIARQNIARLNLFGDDRVSQANRLTLLPLHLHHLQCGPNFIAFTPSTALNLHGSTGTKEERALLYWLVSDVWSLEGAATKNFFQVGVHNDNWDSEVARVRDSIDCLDGGHIDAGVRKRFKSELAADTGLRHAFEATLPAFQRRREKPANVPSADRSARDVLIGRFRNCLARACLTALEPDLIILDEFQRFASLLGGALDGESEEVAELGQQFLAYEGAKILLLSATPYKAYTMATDGEEDHHRDFLRTMAFLMKDDEKVSGLRGALSAFNAALFATAPDARDRLAKAKAELETRLRQHVVRTERLGVSADRDGMVEERPLSACRLEPGDLPAFKALDAIARTLGHRDVVEYWKSAPYVLNFMEKDGYILKKHLLERIGSQAQDATAASNIAAATLDTHSIFLYEPIDPQNPRLRALIAETLDRGAWKLLWLPPSLPYYRSPGTPYDEAQGSALTKVLVFSSWQFVPRAIAAIMSYETERRVAALSKDIETYDDLSTRSRRPLLRFSLDEKGEPRDLNHLIALYPSPTLCELIDPLEEAKSADEGCDASVLLVKASVRLSGRMRTAVPLIRGDKEDPRWYTAFPLRQDLMAHKDDVGTWLEATPSLSEVLGEDEDGKSGNFRLHVERLKALASTDSLGMFPADLAGVVAKAALGAPAIVALRALRRVAHAAGVTGYPAWLLQAAARVGNAFRSLFNQPDATVLTRAVYGGQEERYWEAMLDHCIAGNLQAVMDEHVHVLREALGVASAPAEIAVSRIAEEIEAALSLRAAVLRIDDFHKGDTPKLSEKTINFRCRGALRFNTDPGEEGSSETRADSVRVAFNSPFRPFVLASTAVGQEGLDFHLWCHAIFHWNLPTNPVDFEQREGRVHRYKGHVIRRSVAATLGLREIAGSPPGSDPWMALFEIARARRAAHENDLVPYWVYNGDGSHKIRRYIPALPLSRERQLATRLRASLGAYRMVFGQPRQEDLVEYLKAAHSGEELDPALYAINLSPELPGS